MSPPFYVEKEKGKPVLNFARITETIIGAIIIAMIVSFATDYMSGQTMDKVFTVKMDNMLEKMDEQKVLLQSNSKDDKDFSIEVHKTLSKHGAEIKSIKERINGNN